MSSDDRAVRAGQDGVAVASPPGLSELLRGLLAARDGDFSARLTPNGDPVTIDQRPDGTTVTMRRSQESAAPGAGLAAR